MSVSTVKERFGPRRPAEQAPARRAPGRTKAQAALALGAAGVVFGDIGTSPLYAVQTVFNPADPHPVAETRASVYGVISLIFWAVTIVVTLKYVLLVMRADNEGEGGIMALITLIQREGLPGGRRTKVVLAALGVFGASLFFGDSMITPAISVLSAVEGLKVVEPSLGSLVVPLTAAIVVVLFASQRYGTAAVGRLFGPVMVVWFLVIGACGLSGIAAHPEILAALSPSYALEFLFGNFGTAFFALAAVVLVITGAEALYADMGHFGRLPITAAWLLLVFPALILNYMGQGALLLDHPGANSSGTFFLLVPEWGRVPMVFFATVATVIASQAVITGAYSVAHQAVQLGYLPRLRVVYTSAKTMGQIYVPWINWLLMAAVLALVFAFRTSGALAFAYGMAVTGTITITTLLFFYIARHRWGKPLWLVVARGGRLPRRRPALPRREPDQVRPRRLVPAPGRGDDLHGADHLAAGAAAGVGASASARKAACGPSSTSCTGAGRRCGAPPGPPSSSTAARRRRRWRCAPTSSTTRSSTSRS